MNADNNSAMAIVRFASKDQNTFDRMETHAKRIRTYCDIRRLNIVEEVRFIETGRGDASERSRYSAALQKAVAGGIRHIVFFSSDGMSRDLDPDPIFDLIKAEAITAHFAQEFYCLNMKNCEFFERMS